MSGSPVYDPETGRLIGAVVLRPVHGPTTIAGITPAAEMLGMLRDADRAAARQVVVPRALRRLLRSLRRRQKARRLRVSPPADCRGRLGPDPAAGFDQLDGWFGAGASITRATAAPVLRRRDPGPARQQHGRLAVLRHRDGRRLGTATAVCGDHVVGFGHPLNFAGRHDVLAARRGRGDASSPTSRSRRYKLANLGAPIGTVTEDRLTGIHGVTGRSPRIDVRRPPARRTAAAAPTAPTHVSVPDWFNDIAMSNMVSINDRALDHLGKGGATLTWTIHGLRRNGDPFTVTSGDRYADGYDISVAPLMDLAYQLYALTDNATEQVTITSVSTSTSSMTTPAGAIGKAYWKVGGQWRPITARRPVVLKAGTSKPSCRAALSRPRREVHQAHCRRPRQARRGRRDWFSPPAAPIRRRRVLLRGRGRDVTFQTYVRAAMTHHVPQPSRASPPSRRTTRSGMRRCASGGSRPPEATLDVDEVISRSRGPAHGRHPLEAPTSTTTRTRPERAAAAAVCSAASPSAIAARGSTGPCGLGGEEKAVMGHSYGTECCDRQDRARPPGLEPGRADPQTLAAELDEPELPAPPIEATPRTGRDPGEEPAPV